jgi:hypothetical protein
MGESDETVWRYYFLDLNERDFKRIRLFLMKKCRT